MTEPSASSSSAPAQRPNWEGTKCFVNNVDEYLPGALCAELKLQGNIFLSGTLRGGTKCGQVPPCVKRIVSRVSPSEFMCQVLDHDVIVYDLHSTDLEELEFVLSAFSTYDFRRPVSLVLISSLMTWARTPCELPNRPGPPVVPKTATNKRWKEGFNHQEPRILTDAECDTRTPSVRFADWKAYELSWAALSKKSNVRAVVVGAGLAYGNGEHVFQDWFENCWNRNFERNLMIGDGTNYIPVVHCRNLARFTRYAVFAPVDQRQSYYIAVDQTPSTQRELLERTRLAFEEEDPRIITTLEAEPAEGEGEPLSEEAREFSLANVLHSSIHVEQAVLLENVDLLTVNMRFRPSAEMFQFAQWGGESWNGDKLAEEFGAWRGLSPLRAVVAGAPGTYQQYLPRIATYFSVEILTIKDIVSEFLAREERKLFFRRKEHALFLEANPPPEEGSEEFESYEPVPEPELPEHAQTVQALDFSAEEARNQLPAEALDALKIVLTEKFGQCRCRTKGFLLDSWPVTQHEATELFSELRYIPPPPPPETKTSYSGRSSRPGSSSYRGGGSGSAAASNAGSPSKEKTAANAESGEAAAAGGAGAQNKSEKAEGAVEGAAAEPQGTYERFLLPGCPDVFFLFSAADETRQLECELLPEESAGLLPEKMDTPESAVLAKIAEQRSQQEDVIAQATEENPLPDDFERIATVVDFFREHKRLCECNLEEFYEEFNVWGREEMEFRSRSLAGEEEGESAEAELGPDGEPLPEPTEEELAEKERQKEIAEKRKEDRRVKREKSLFGVKPNAFVAFFLEKFEKATGKKFRNFLPPLDTERVVAETPASENAALAGFTMEESPEELAEKEAMSRRAAQRAEQERKYQEKLQREEETQLEEVSEPLRKYLAEFVTPHVTEALIEICRVTPEDPVDYLAEYLFFKSEELKGPELDD